VPFPKIDTVEQSSAPHQGPRLAQQIGVHVTADQAIGAGRPPRRLAHNDTGPTADLEHAVSGLDRQRVEQRPHDRHIARAAALLEAGDAAEQRAAGNRK
jgi:hypothetical protein